MNPRVSHYQSHAQLWKVDDVFNVMRDNLIGGPFAAEVVRVLTSELFSISALGILGSAALLGFRHHHHLDQVSDVPLLV